MPVDSPLKSLDQAPLGQISIRNDPDQGYGGVRPLRRLVKGGRVLAHFSPISLCAHCVESKVHRPSMTQRLATSPCLLGSRSRGQSTIFETVQNRSLSQSSGSHQLSSGNAVNTDELHLLECPKIGNELHGDVIEQSPFLRFGACAFRVCWCAHESAGNFDRHGDSSLTTTPEKGKLRGRDTHYRCMRPRLGVRRSRTGIMKGLRDAADRTLRLELW